MNFLNPFGAENPMPGNSRTIPFPTHVRMLVYAQLNTLSSAFSAFPSYIFRHFNAAAFTLRCYLFYFVRMRFISSFHQSIAFIIPVLMTFLQLKYQGNYQKSPFATHPRSMRVAVSSSVVYYLACVVLLRFSMRRFAVVAHHCLVWSGYASVAALASVLFPDSVSPFIYALFVLLSAGELLYWLYHKLAVEEEEGGDFQRVRRFVNNICRVVANTSGQRPQILPI
ncbi:hypothetical protein Pfo_026834 [Paulownia fortunei]|nr:hypothetical protein Pfo_026834 [Paulownia fortunei]